MTALSRGPLSQKVCQCTWSGPEVCRQGHSLHTTGGTIQQTFNTVPQLNWQAAIETKKNVAYNILNNLSIIAPHTLPLVIPTTKSLSPPSHIVYWRHPILEFLISFHCKKSLPQGLHHCKLLMSPHTLFFCLTIPFFPCLVSLSPGRTPVLTILCYLV